MKEQTVGKFGLAGSLLAAVGTSVCCIGPLAAAFLGLTSLGGLVRFEPYRPLLAVFTLGFLGSAFYLAYRKRTPTECAPGSICEAHGQSRIERLNRIVLWIVAAAVLVILTFPTWSNWVLG